MNLTIFCSNLILKSVNTINLKVKCSRIQKILKFKTKFQKHKKI